MDGDMGGDALAVRQDVGHGHSLVARTAFAAGDVLHHFGIRETVAEATYLSVQIGEGQHIHLAPRMLQFINHSCDPNVYFDVDASCVICLRDILPAEEIAFFYPSTEWDMSRPFDCQCDEPSCLGTIRGAAHISRPILARYRLAPHIQQRLACTAAAPSRALAATE